MAEPTSILGAFALFSGMGFLIAIAVLLLTGFSLYKSARQKQQGWFWAILIVGPFTFGLLAVIYLLTNSGKEKLVR